MARSCGHCWRETVSRLTFCAPGPRRFRGDRYRRRLLDEDRGFEQRSGLFQGWPKRVDWYRVALEPEEVLGISA
jgi:hypothetical protein